MRTFLRNWVEKHFSLEFPSARSRFKYLADSLRSWTTEKSDLSSANNLAMEMSPSGRSLIYIKNNRGPSRDPCVTLALMGSQLDS